MFNAFTPTNVYLGDGNIFQRGRHTLSNVCSTWFETVAGTAYTLSSKDKGRSKTFNSATTVTVTLPNSLPKDYKVDIVQLGVGQVVFSLATNATLRNKSSHTKVSGQYGRVSLAILSNSDGAHSEYLMTGDTGA